MPVGYVIRRIGVFFVIIWAAATINFVIPRLSPSDPVQERLLQQQAVGGVGTANIEEVIKSYREKFGLDQPLYQQYVNYLWDTAQFDFGFSIVRFPTTVSSMIMNALPWTLILVTTATLIAFIFGTLFGALLAWPRAPKFVQGFAPPVLAMSAVPYYLLGIVLIYFIAFKWGALPLGGGYTVGSETGWDLDFILDAFKHSILPALSIVLSAAGFWALTMRGMMVTVQGEDYVTLAEAKGLNPSRIFFRYAMRNAILPQTTALALALGNVMSGLVLVEVVFGYPGIGSLLYQAIRQFDYTVIYGITFMVIVAIGLATLALDLLLPVLDPRITYQRN